MFEIFNKYPDIKFHSYARSSNNSKAHEKLNQCIIEIMNWFKTNSLCMNNAKTQAICINTNTLYTSIINNSKLVIDNYNISLSDNVKNLGVIFDNKFNLDSFINSKIKKANYQLYRIRQIRSSLTFHTCKILVSSLVLSIIDYCCVILINIPASHIANLERCIRSAVRVVYNLPKYTKDKYSISDLLINLNWLTVKQRIDYKLALLTHNAYQHHNPQYLSSLIKPVAERTARRDRHRHRIESLQETSSTGRHQRAFALAAPTLWNSLPVEIRSNTNTPSFKTDIKKYLMS